jgi:ribosomal protein S18 acetylase RimI-like enzyme
LSDDGEGGAPPAAGRGEPGVEIGPAQPGEPAAIGRLLAEAFLDDPVWMAIGPRVHRGYRRFANRASFWGIVQGSRRHGARIRVARLAGETVGATIAFDPGGWPMPERSALWELPWLLAAGPLPMLRGLRDDRTIRSHHVTHPHMYLWFIGVRPDLHRRGVGRSLLAELHADADRGGLPTYLETGTERNVRLYESAGYSLLGEIELPSGARMWRMERPAPGAAGDPGSG